MGELAVGDVDTTHVMAALEPIWREKPETATRLRGRIESVLDYAKARGWRTGENPARWRGHVANMLPKRSKVAAVEHHATLPWRVMGAFMEGLATREPYSVAALALRFVILTGARSGEVLGARWNEIDLAEGVWTVPADRMKAGREHRVPLTDAALDVLRAAARLRTNKAADAYVFSGQRPCKPLSGMAMAMLLRRMGRGDLTAHGFRSTFRDWAAETTAFDRETAEAALAHTLKDKVEAAYRRGDLLDKRRRLMEAWGPALRYAGCGGWSGGASARGLLSGSSVAQLDLDQA
jgi:integrase